MRRATSTTAALVAATLVLAGCTPPAAAPSAWQQSVQTLASQAATGDYASALANLDALEADVIARRDAGEITADEADGILSRIATVRADLASLAPTPTPTPTEQETEPAQDSVSDDGGDQQSDPPAEQQPTDQQPTDQGPGGKGGDKGDKGPGAKDSGPGKKDG